jgi:hypothetical protein
MERGLLWTPLLILFIGLAWSGWNEYQKVEIYRQWAENFDRAKYDIYAVLGQKDQTITWGKPTRKGVINLQIFSLDEVKEIHLLVNNQVVSLDSLPPKGSAFVEFIFADQSNEKIPFTEIELASQWAKFLQQQISSEIS